MTQNQKNSRPQINFLKEVGKLFKDFFRRKLINDTVLEQPRKLRSLIFKANVGNFIVYGIIFNVFSYLTLAGNYAIEKGFGLLGIIFYMLSTAQSVIALLYHQWETNIKNNIRFLRDDSITLIGSNILTKVAWNVYEKEANHYKQSSNEEITNSTARYLTNSWDIQTQYYFNILELFTVIVMLIATMLTNRIIPQELFIPLIIITGIAHLFASAYDRIHHSKFVKDSRTLDNEKSIVKNDLLRVIPIISEDQVARIRKYSNLINQHFDKQKKLVKKDFISDIVTTLIHVISSYVLIIAYIANSGEITLATIAGLTASLTVFNKAVGSFGRIVRTLTNVSYCWDTIEKEEEMMKNIIAVYHKKINTEIHSISSLCINPFSIKYREVSENDKPFSLILNQNIRYEKGDCIALTGASGSGKSTFLKVTTSRISFRNVESSNIKPLNYMFYDETIDFGRCSLFDELFCLDSVTKPKPTPEELAKMEYILTAMNLYKEISENCKDFWTWMKENKAYNLSRGQKQRLIIAKILFWLNDSIDIVALDECTSGLDAEAVNDKDNPDALKILNFIIDYCNHDRKRIIFLATHQNIDSLCNHKLHFKRSNGQTTIQKIY